MTAASTSANSANNTSDTEARCPHTLRTHLKRTIAPSLTDDLRKSVRIAAGSTKQREVEATADGGGQTRPTERTLEKRRATGAADGTESKRKKMVVKATLRARVYPRGQKTPASACLIRRRRRQGTKPGEDRHTSRFVNAYWIPWHPSRSLSSSGH